MDHKGKLFGRVFAINLSHLPRPVINPAPGYAQLPAIKFLNHDKFLPPTELVPTLR